MPEIPEKILIRSVNWLGDAIMTLPALAVIRSTFPQAQISLLVARKLAGLWDGQPCVDSVLPFESKSSLFSRAKIARASEAQASLILPNSPRSALECWLGRIPVRSGYAGRWRKLFLTHSIARRNGIATMHKRCPEEIKRLLQDGMCNCAQSSQSIYSPASHHVYDYLHLAKEFIQLFKPGTQSVREAEIDPTPRLHIQKEEQEEVLKRFGIPTGDAQTPILGVNAGAEYGPAKRWPVENFAQAVALVTRRTSARWILFGGPADTPLACELEKLVLKQVSSLKMYRVTGKTTLHELAVLSSLCRIFLTNDTGPMHVAAAAGSTVAVPFLSTSRELTCPGAPLDERRCPNRHVLLKAACSCSPCFLKVCPIDFRCAGELKAEVIAEAICRKLQN